MVFEHSCLRQLIGRTIPKIMLCIPSGSHAVRAKSRSDHHSNDSDSSTFAWEHNLGSISIYTEGKREEEGAVYEEDAGSLSLSRVRASASTLVARRSLEDEGDNDEEMEDAESDE